MKWILASQYPSDKDVKFVRYAGFKDTAYCEDKTWYNSNTDEKLPMGIVNNMEYADESPAPVQQEGRPIIKDFFGKDVTLTQVHETYLSQPELFKYAQALDNYIDELTSTPPSISIGSAEEIKEVAINFSIWLESLSRRKRMTVWPPAGSGLSTGLYERTNEDLFDEFIKIPKQ